MCATVDELDEVARLDMGMQWCTSRYITIDVVYVRYIEVGISEHACNVERRECVKHTTSRGEWARSWTLLLPTGAE